MNTNNNDSDKKTKTYLVTNTFETYFPAEFRSSRNNKWIEVRECRIKYKGKLIGDVCMHADFIERDHYLDYFCTFVNDFANTRYKKFAYYGTKQSFKIWFTTLDQKPLEIDTPDDLSFVLELLLCY
jgi:hypothetical protein